MISVIIPVYNASNYLGEAIDSVLRQAYTNLELILINDGSTDDSKEICDKYKKSDNRVKVIHTENGGPSAARNKGIENSSGEFLFFLDADDYIEPRALQILSYKQLKFNSDFTICDFVKLVGTETVSSGHQTIFNTDKLLDKETLLVYINNYLCSPNKNPLLTQSWGRLFRRSLVVDNDIWFNSTLRTFEDVEFNFKYLEHVTNLLFVNEPLYTLRIHTDHFSATMKLVDTPDSLFGYRAALRQVGSFLLAEQGSEFCQKNLLKAYVTYSIIQLIRLSIQECSDNKQNIFIFVKGLLQDPILQKGLKQFTPSNGDSKLIPFFMKTKLTRLLLYTCKRRGSKRYKK